MDPEAFGLFGPDLADELIGCQTPQRLEPAGVVVGIHEELQVISELIVTVVVVAFDRRVLDRAVHPLDLAVGPTRV